MAKKETNKKSAKSTNKTDNKNVTKKVAKKEVEKELKVVEVPEVEETEEEIIIKEITEEGSKKRVSKRDIIIAVIFLVIGIAISTLFVNRIPKLKDGNEVVVSLSNSSYSAQDLYSEMRVQYGLNTILRKIDLDLVSTYFDGAKDEDAKTNAAEQAETYISQYTSYGYSEEDFLAYYGFKTKDEFVDYLAEDYILNEYYNEYTKKNITEEEINDYYTNYGIGKKTVYIFSETGSTDNLEAVRKALKKGTDIATVVSKYKETITVNEALEIDYNTITSYTDTIISYVKKTAKGKYSKVFSDDQFGNVVIYVSEEEDTPKLEDIKEDIINVLVSKIQSEDSTVYYKAFIELRKENGIKFYDKDLKSQYNEYVKTYTGTKEEETTEE